MLYKDHTRVKIVTCQDGKNIAPDLYDTSREAYASWKNFVAPRKVQILKNKAKARFNKRGCTKKGITCQKTVV